MNTNRPNRSVRIAVLVLVAAGLTLPALAGERRGGRASGAGLDPARGDAVGSRHVDAWQSLRGIVRHDRLGATDGRDGDLWPTIGEAQVAPDRPWVVWSRYNGDGYDLAYTRWIERAWMPADWVDGDQAIDSLSGSADDLDPAMDFDRAGRPVIAWWRDEGGRGRVYFSVFLASRWLDPIPVTIPAVDARHPSVEVVGGDTVRISFDTPTGRIRHTILFQPPVTITDDLNPLDFRFRTDRIEIVKKAD